MSLGKNLSITFLASLALALAGCSGGGSSSSSNAIETAVQDLDQDAEGMTTAITFDTAAGLATATAANFESDGGQTAQSVVVVDDQATVTWDERVTPSDQVRAIGLADVSSAYHPVTTTDSSAPTFTITGGTQGSGVGDDSLTINFSGVHVVEATVEDPAQWTLKIGTTTLDLTGSTFTFNTSTQEVDVDLGALAHLHAAFSLTANGVTSVADVAAAATPVIGAASGDAVAPTLLSANQNLALDEYGRTIDFTFSEHMSPVFSTALSHFAVPLPDVATSVEQPSPGVLSVTFNNPIVPGVDQVTLTTLVDLHGNAFPDVAQAISQPAPVANAYVGNVQGVTVQNALNDYLLIETVQAFDPSSAVDPARWSLTVAGNPVTMADQTFEYDFLAKKLTITLDFDMQNGQTFTIAGNGVLDVDGQLFNAGQFNTISGETTAPTVTGAVQNRDLDLRGRTVDVQMSEDVDAISAEALASWSDSGTQNLVSATLLPSLDQVRLVFDATVVPGEVTLTADAIEDLAGNPMTAAQPGIAITSTDITPPAATSASASAIAGANNDTLAATFNDNMLPSEIEDSANWSVESPVGSAVSTAGAVGVYNTATRTATLTFENGVNFARDDDFRVVFANARDLGGNTVTAAASSGTIVAETTLPLVHTVYREIAPTDQLVVRFSEPCGQLTDLYDATTNPDGTRYALRTNLGALRSFATGATAEDDGLGVRLSFGVVIAASDTLDVIGVTDLAGNPLFPALSVPTVAEDTAEPSLATGFSVLTTVSGENNDVITVTFDRPMSPWNLLSTSNYTVTGSGPVSMSGAAFSFDGTDTVTIALKSGTGHNLATGDGYDLSIVDVWSAQGAERSVADTELGIPAGGDATAPTVAVGAVRLDPNDASSLLLEVNEAVDVMEAQTATNYDYDNGNFATSAVVIGPRTIRASFGVAPSAGFDLEFVVRDLAGNVSGPITRAVAIADVAGPLVSAVSGFAVSGWGGDYVAIAFNEPVGTTSALSSSNYTIQNGSTSISLVGAVPSYTSTTNTVTFRLAGGVELDFQQPITVTIQGVFDVAGNAMAAQVQLGGTVGGDSIAPALTNAFVNLAQAANGTVVDVLFSEDVDTSFATSAANWTASGATVNQVTCPERNHARVTLSAALAAAGTLGINGLPDLAHNTSGAIQIDPVE